jgi:hypothetical protein
MMKAMPKQRIRIPNGLAMFAALVLLVSSVVGFEANHEADSAGQGMVTSAKAGSVENNGISESASTKRRGLRLGLILFRRG